MRELDKYNVLKEKLQGICDENNLTYSIQNRTYPFLMTVKPLGGMDAQQTMLEGMDNGETGYISPDASLVFAYRDGVLNYKISETFTISDALFTKIKNLCKKLHDMWMMHFYRDVIECGGAPSCGTPTPAQDAENCDAEDEDTDAAFADFMDTAAPAVDDEE
jgi:hypothetical protein